MKVSGIIAEYNPFHNGHAYHIEQTRKNGATHIIAVMSGNFVQRGDCAMFDKWARTLTSLRGGVDLVIELPCQFATATAERFGAGAVSVLDSVGCVDELSFGSECGDIELLKKAALANLSDQLDKPIVQGLKNGKSYAAARSDAVREIFGDDAARLFESPNDTLGIEYLSAIMRQNSKIKPTVIKRHLINHDESGEQNGFASASHIRETIMSGGDFSGMMSAQAYSVFSRCVENKTAPATLDNAQAAVLWTLRQMTEDDFCKLCDASEGLPFRLYNAVRSATSLDEIYLLAATRRYPLARIRRMVLSAVLRTNAHEQPPYIRVLGFNTRGEELLKIMKQSAKLPFVTSYSQAVSLGEAAEKYYMRSALQTDFYTLTMPQPLSCGEEMRRSVVKI